MFYPMEIGAHTKISALIKANPAAIEAIASINRHFEKLRNPILRKILAARVTIADAARLGGCGVETFFERLAPLGFVVQKEKEGPVPQVPQAPAVFPLFLKKLPQNAFTYLDVREDIAMGNYPFLRIMQAVDQLNEKQALVLINTFEPTPLLQILQKRGFLNFTHEKEPELVYTYFWRQTEEVANIEEVTPETDEYNQVLTRFSGNMKRVDVRQLEMPQPMVTILNELEWLPTGQALHVTHKRVPQFLLPQLESRGFQVAIQDAGPHQTYLLIYKL